MERELEKVDGVRLTNIIFDETGHFVLYGTMLGIKVINVETNRWVCTRLSVYVRFAQNVEPSLSPQMRADSREAGEHPRGPAESVPGGRNGHEGGADCGDEGVGQPRVRERGVRPHHLLHRVQEEPLLHGETL